MYSKIHIILKPTLLTILLLIFSSCQRQQVTSQADGLQNKLKVLKITADRAAIVGFHSESFVTKQFQKECNQWTNNRFCPLKGKIMIYYIYSKELGKSGIVCLDSTKELQLFAKCGEEFEISKDLMILVWSGDKK